MEPIEASSSASNATSRRFYPPILPSPCLAACRASAGISWAQFFHVDRVRRKSGVEALGKALSDAGIDLRPDDPPSNANVAGQSGLSAGAIAIDSNQPRAAWIWPSPITSASPRKTPSPWLLSSSNEPRVFQMNPASCSARMPPWF